ncbi:MAG: DUF523 domain-containing protein [Deltaproteobacteria bacterium]|nr:DUF523 domain-containing protein [Deltaproteobacteria bacterium]
MKNKVEKKVAVVSKCLLGYRCRFDGEIRNYGIKEMLNKRNYEVVGVCPELEIGLGVPREPIRLVLKGKRILLIQKKTQMKLKRKLERFSKDFLSRLKRIDVFVLKSKSPSCGNNDCKVFSNLKDEIVVGFSDGVFTKVCKRFFPGVYIFNEENIFSLDIL